MNAVIRIAGRQYVVAPQMKMVLPNLAASPGEIKEIKEVLMVNEEGRVEVGSPYLPYKVTLEVLSLKRGPKGYSIRFFRRGGRRVIRGYRAQYVEVLVKSITQGE
ncbi:MAG: 50S ribosomal protein L21 [bacterium]